MPNFVQMWKSLQMTVRACLVLVAKVWSFLTYIFKKQVRAVSRRLNNFHLLTLTLFRYNNTKPSNMTSPPCPPSPDTASTWSGRRCWCWTWTRPWSIHITTECSGPVSSPAPRPTSYLKWPLTSILWGFLFTRDLMLISSFLCCVFYAYGL